MEVNRDQGIIVGAPVISLGETVDGRYVVDQASLAAVLALMEARAAEGTPVLAEHGGESTDLIGRLISPRIEGDRVVADLALLQSAEDRDLLLEAAQVMPSAFGLSINALVEPREDRLLRPLTLYSVDLAQVPAANRRGLLSAAPDNVRPDMTPDEIKLMIEEAMSARLADYETKMADLTAKLEAMTPPAPPVDPKPMVDEMAATLRAELTAAVAAVPARLRAEMGATLRASPAADKSGPATFREAVARLSANDKTLPKTHAIREAIRQHPDLYAAARASGDLSV